MKITGLTLQEIGPEIAATLGASEARAAAGDPLKARADLLGIAIHCARGSALCSNANARPDLLPDERGGYAGFSALFGNRNVQPLISPDGPVRDLDGDIIDDDSGHPGCPGASEATAAQSLGYAAAMLEAGVPVVYVGIGNAHRPAAARRRALGPGERDHVARLAADDAAFKIFIDRLTAALDKLVEEDIRPRYEEICDIVQELLGADGDRQMTRLCVRSILGQCLFYRHSQPVLARLEPEQR